MYRHFLVPVGGTDAAIEAVGHALEFARSIGARVTFVHACAVPGRDHDAASAEDRAAEWLAKAEAAARAHGVPCARASYAEARADDAGFEALAGAAREHGCDLVCVSTDAAWLVRRSNASETFASCGMPVMICTAQRNRAADLAIGVLLDEHRAIGAELHVLLTHVRTAVSRSVPLEAIVLRSIAIGLRNLLALGHRPGEDACLFPKLRERTSALDAELAELERQHQHEIRLIDELIDTASAVAEGELSPARFEQQLHMCAQFTWEHMGREEGVILPAARRYLREADWRDIGAALGIAEPSVNIEHTISEHDGSRGLKGDKNAKCSPLL
jgi:nucleotide-binding universal stress UspA family protein